MENNSSGIGVAGIVFIVFLILKLTDNIDWSWWWVTSPLWIPIGIVTIIILLIKLSDLQMRKMIKRILKGIGEILKYIGLLF